MTDKDAAVEPALVCGAALYWGAIVACFLFPGSEPATPTLLDDAAVKYLALGVFVAVGFAWPRVYSSGRGRRLVLLAMLVACLVATLPALFGASGAAFVTLATLCHLFAISVLMVLWGFAFASMDKRHAGQNVAVAMLLSACVVLVETQGARALPLSLATRALMVASACILLSGKVRFRSEVRARTDDFRRGASSFALSRLAFGAVMGFGIEASAALAPRDASLALSLAAACALVVTLAAVLRSAGRLYFALPTLLLLSVVVTFLPFLDGGSRALCGASVGLVWLVWAAFSAFQLSDLKERCGVGELGLCLVEKALLSCAMVLGVLACRALSALGVVGVSGQAGLGAGGLFLLAASGALVLGATYEAGCLVGQRAQDSMREQLACSRQQHRAAVCDELAGEFGLSAREREVMGMLADGYTRAFIRESLGISDGTAKAHIAHVYAKMGIHHKDDLLEFVDERASRG